MTIRPILFSGPMVRALLDGRKTQDRRIMKLPTRTQSGGVIYDRPDMGGWQASTIGGNGCFTIGKDGERIPVPEKPVLWHGTCGTCLALPFAPGDLLWVRETWENAVGNGDVSYRATVHDDTDGAWTDEEIAAIRWRPSIHMPRWASRLTLEVTQVRVERLQDITEDDAIAEGIARSMWPGGMMYSVAGLPDDAWRSDPRDIFRALWTRICGPYAWDTNPWVVAVSFTVHRCNVDQMGDRP